MSRKTTKLINSLQLMWTWRKWGRKSGKIQYINYVKFAVHFVPNYINIELLPTTSPGKVCPIVGWNLHAGKLNVEYKTWCRRKAWISPSSSRGAPFFATLYDFFTAEPSSNSEKDTVSSFCETSRILCRAVLFFSDHHFRPARTFCAALSGPRLIQSLAKWIMANCYVRRPPPNQSRLGLRTGFCAQVEISGGVRGKNYLQGIFQILEKKPSGVLFPLPQRLKKGILARN